MKNLRKLVVFTDLDGTLLDHDTYRWDQAQPALDRLRAADVPVVLASSKTAPEIEILQKQMDLIGLPAIVENGAGLIGLPATGITRTYDALRNALDQLPVTLRKDFRGFGDMSIAELATQTGLSVESAKLAKARGYSEPGVWSGGDVQLRHFLAALSEKSITAQRGGRFLTLSFGQTKADGMDSVISAFRPEMTLALGDAPNDIAMLEKADFGVIVANPHRPSLPPLPGEKEGSITRTRGAGPVGWNAVVNAFLDTLPLAEGTQANG